MVQTNYELQMSGFKSHYVIDGHSLNHLCGPFGKTYVTGWLLMYK